MPAHPFDNGELKIRDEQLAPWPRTKPVIKEHLRDYYALITHNDERVGDILNALKAQGMYDNTIIIYSGDNGLAVGQHGLMGKQNLYEHSMGVPLIIAGPGIPNDVRTDAMVYLTDLFPTLCDYLNIDIPESVQGESFFNVLKDPGSDHREQITTSYKKVQHSVRDARYKLIRYDVKGKVTLQLFDLLNDPYETKDLSQDSDHAEILEKLMIDLNTAFEIPSD
jgi:arylsulfatase A-like enzyme